jgi:hypothetical protein
MTHFLRTVFSKQYHSQVVSLVLSRFALVLSRFAGLSNRKSLVLGHGWLIE